MAAADVNKPVASLFCQFASAVSTWLNAGVDPAQVAEWAGHTVDVLLRVYAKCIAGKQDEAKRRILEATQPADTDRPALIDP